MAGNGKYTNYAPVASGRNARLGKLFVGTDTTKNPFAVYVETGNAEGAREALLNGDGENFAVGAKALLQPAVQDSGNAEASLFGGKTVNLDYSGGFPDGNGITVPNTAEGHDVVWAAAGDPVNPFMPDLRSPGPGSTDAEVGNMADAPADEVSAVALIKPDYIVGGPGTGTTSPNTTTPKVIVRGPPTPAP